MSTQRLSKLRWAAAGALAALGLTAAVWSVQAAGPASSESYVPLGVANADGKNSTAWFLDVARQRVIYCTTLGSLSGAPRCETGPIPK